MGKTIGRVFVLASLSYLFLIILFGAIFQVLDPGSAGGVGYATPFLWCIAAVLAANVFFKFNGRDFSNQERRFLLGTLLAFNALIYAVSLISTATLSLGVDEAIVLTLSFWLDGPVLFLTLKYAWAFYVYGN